MVLLRVDLASTFSQQLSAAVFLPSLSDPLISSRSTSPNVFPAPCLCHQLSQRSFLKVFRTFCLYEGSCLDVGGLRFSSEEEEEGDINMDDYGTWFWDGLIPFLKLPDSSLNPSLRAITSESSTVGNAGTLPQQHGGSDCDVWSLQLVEDDNQPCGDCGQYPAPTVTNRNTPRPASFNSFNRSDKPPLNNITATESETIGNNIFGPIAESVSASCASILRVQRNEYWPWPTYSMGTSDLD